MSSVQSCAHWQSTKNTVFIERNYHMFNNSDINDVNFTCEDSDKIFNAHKYVLAKSSAVFQTMFYGSLAEKDATVHLPDTDEESLEQFLRYVYTGECTMTADNAVTIIYLAKKYMLPSLNEKCVDFLSGILNAKNVLDVLEQADFFDEKKLKIGCWKFILSNIKELVASDSISQKALVKLLKRDEPNIQEECLKQSLRYIHTDECTMTTENAVAIMYLLKKYSLPSINGNFVSFLLGSLNPENVLDVLEQAIRFDEKEVEKRCWEVIASKTAEVVASDAFNNISRATLAQLMKQDKLSIHDGRLLQAALKWFDFQCSHKKMEPTAENRKSIVEMKWKLPSSIAGNIVRFSRFSGKPEDLGDGWEYHGIAENNYVDINVDKDSFYVGARLFGDRDGSEYKLETGTYTSELSEDGIPGFDAMAPEPCVFKASIGICISAIINGPASVYGKNGISSVTRDGVTMTFGDWPYPKFGIKTSVDHGQFHEIILMI